MTQRKAVFWNPGLHGRGVVTRKAIDVGTAMLTAVLDPAMPQDTSLKLTDREIAEMFSNPVDAEQNPPIMTLEEAAAMLRMSPETLRDWRSRGLLADCSRKLGKQVKFLRDRLVKRLFNKGLRAE